jgi:hypothetical protein
MIYHPRLKGELENKWSDWLGSIQITAGPMIITLTADEVDQSVIFSLLDGIRIKPKPFSWTPIGTFS